MFSKIQISFVFWKHFSIDSPGSNKLWCHVAHVSLFVTKARSSKIISLSCHQLCSLRNFSTSGAQLPVYRFSLLWRKKLALNNKEGDTKSAKRIFSGKLFSHSPWNMSCLKSSLHSQKQVLSAWEKIHNLLKQKMNEGTRWQQQPISKVYEGTIPVILQDPTNLQIGTKTK